METIIEKELVDPVISTMIGDLELMIGEYNGTEDHRYDSWTIYGKGTRKIRPGKVLFCISRKRDKELTVVKKFNTTKAATTFFDSHVSALKLGKFKITYKPQMTYEI